MMDDYWIDGEGRITTSKGELFIGEAVQSEPTVPSLLHSGVEALKSAGMLMKSRASKVDDETLKKRMATCSLCGFLTSNGQCGDNNTDKRGCGCFMEIKARYEAMQCPRGLWDK